MLLAFAPAQAETPLWDCPIVARPVDAAPLRDPDASVLDEAWGDAIAEALVWVDPSCVACEAVAEGEPWVDFEWTTGTRCTADCAGVDGSWFTFLDEELETEDAEGARSSVATYELAVERGEAGAPWASASLWRQDVSQGGTYGGGSTTEWSGAWTSRTPDAWAQGAEAAAGWGEWSSDDTTSGREAEWSDPSCAWSSRLEDMGYYDGDSWEVSVGTADVVVVEVDGACTATLDGADMGQVDCATWEPVAEPCGCTAGASGAAWGIVPMAAAWRRRRARSRGSGSASHGMSA